MVRRVELRTDVSIVNQARESKQNLPVAISLGGDPLLGLLAALPMIDDPRLFAGLLRGAGLETVRCRTNELEVPAAAEIIIEGYIDAENTFDVRCSASFPVAQCGNGPLRAPRRCH